MGGWHITFGKKDYLSIKRQQGSAELNAALEHSLRRIRKNVNMQYRYGEFMLLGGACPLLREGKCGLQLEKGERVLPYVCRTFPRKEMPMPSGYLERALSPACEGVLSLLWELPEGVTFRSDPLKKEEWRTCTYNEEVSPLYAHFSEIRELCIDVLQDRRRSLPQRILLLGMVLKPLSDGETDIPAWLARGRTLLESGETADLLGKDLLLMFLVHNANTLLSIRDGDLFFRDAQRTLRSVLGLPTHHASRETVQPGPYLAARERFDQEFGDKDYFFENLMVSIFFLKWMPDLSSLEDLWKNYVNFCNLYAAYRFMSVMSCREGVEDCKQELFDLLVLTSRTLIHNRTQQNALRDGLFRHDSATLAHMAVLLSG